MRDGHFSSKSRRRESANFKHSRSTGVKAFIISCNFNEYNIIIYVVVANSTVGTRSHVTVLFTHLYQETRSKKICSLKCSPHRLTFNMSKVYRSFLISARTSVIHFYRISYNSEYKLQGSDAERGDENKLNS